MAKIRRDIDQEFLEYLEYKICKLYQQLRPKEKVNHWCRSITVKDLENCNVAYVTKNREVLLKAFVERYGRMEYDVHLKFGKQSVGIYSKGLDLKNCFPGNKNTEFFVIDFENKSIHITLD